MDGLRGQSEAALPSLDQLHSLGSSQTTTLPAESIGAGGGGRFRRESDLSGGRASEHLPFRRCSGSIKVALFLVNNSDGIVSRLFSLKIDLSTSCQSTRIISRAPSSSPSPTDPRMQLIMTSCGKMRDRRPRRTKEERDERESFEDRGMLMLHHRE